MKITDCQPDLGNPTVRDERGAYGNVSYGGTRNPLHTPKGCRTETLCLRLRAPYFYPTSGACIQRGDSGTWESQWCPCRASGIGVPASEAKTPGAGRRLVPLRRTLHEQGTQSKMSATRYRRRTGSTERLRERLLAVLADHSTDGREPAAPGREGGEPMSQGPTGGSAARLTAVLAGGSPAGAIPHLAP